MEQMASDLIEGKARLTHGVYAVLLTHLIAPIVRLHRFVYLMCNFGTSTKEAVEKQSNGKSLTGESEQLLE